MKTPLIPAPFFAAFALCLTSLSDAAEVTLTPIMDAAVSEAPPADAYPTSNLVVGRSGGAVWATYLRFDLSSIPVSAEITAAEIRLQGSNLSSGGTLELASPLGSWSESTVTWQNQPAASVLGQSVLEVENATSATLNLGPNALGYLQNVVRNAVPDRGLKLSLAGAEADDYLAIQSRESSNEPRLLVTYTPGEALPDFTAALAAGEERLQAQLFEAPEVGAAADYELVWNTKPGLRYQLWESSDLNQWNPVPGYPVEAASLSDVYEVQQGGNSTFYRVEVLDEQPPEIVSHFPADEAFGIRRFYPNRSEVGVQIRDASGIDPESISLNLGSRGTFTLASPELTFQNGVLSFETGSDTAMGAYGQGITATLNVADTLGQSTSYNWNFQLEEEVVLVDDLVIFGSAESQRAGQRIPYTPTRVLAGDPGPVRANNNGWEIETVTADTVVIDYDAAAPSFAVGQYLTNRTPRTADEIFYRRVLSTSNDVGQQRLTISTEDVAAYEIMESGTVSLSGDELAFEVDELGNIVGALALKSLEVSGEVEIEPVEIDWSGKELAGFYSKPDDSTGMAMAGFHPNAQGVLDFGLEDQAPGGAAWAGKLKLKRGRITATPTLSIAVKTGFFSLQKFQAESEMRVDAVVEPEFEFYGAELAAAEVEKTLWRFDWIIPIGGPVPIWVTVTPRINGRAGFSAGLSGSFSVGAQGGFTDTITLDYEKDRDPGLEYDRKIGSPTFSLIDPEIQLSGEIEASATLEPEIEVKLLSLVGFYVNVDPTVYANLNADFSTGSLASAEVGAGIRTNLNAGMSVTGLSDSLFPSFGTELHDTAWSWSFPEPAPEAPLAILRHPQSTTVSPGGTLRLTVAANHGEGVSYEWRQNGKRLFDFGPELVRYGVDSGAAGSYQVILRREGSPDVISELATVTVGGGGPAPAGFVEVPGGSFQMGDSFNEGGSDERPVHTVEVSRFYMQSTEVTNAQMAEVINWAHGQGLVTVPTSTVRNVNGNSQELLDMNDSDIRLSWIGSEIVVDSGYEDHPVVEVTWYEAVAYCQFRSQMEGLSPCYDFSDWSCDFTRSGYRLPTEAEWEKAARLAASNAGETWRYPFGNSIDSTKAHYNRIHGGTQQVASYPATAGLYDMAGNVSEWCHDWYDNSYYSSSPASDPSGPAAASARVFRGGGWDQDAILCRVAYRSDDPPTSSDSGNGFRPVRR